jgi:hypothetical protein
MALTSPTLFTPFSTATVTPPSFPIGPITPPIFLPAPVMPLKFWSVVHYRHDGTALGDEYPSSPQFAMYLGKMGYLNYDLDRSSALAIKDNCEPYGTDYGLFFGDHKLQGGIHTDIQIDDIESHTLQISGKDWYHWFEGQIWPFDPNDPLSTLYTAFDIDIFTIVEDWLDVIQSEANTIQFTYNNGTAGAVARVKIEANDTENMYDKFTTLSQGNPSFDIDITPDRVVNLYYPKKSRDIDYSLVQGNNIYELSYHNKGPSATRLVGTGQGPSSKLGVIEDDPSIIKYRRWMANEDFGNVVDVTDLDNKVVTAIGRHASPNLEFTCKIIPSFVEDIFSVLELGDNVPVYGKLGWDTIDARFRLVSITASPNDEGDQEYELGFDDGTISL